MKRVYIIVGSMRPHWLGKRIAQWVRINAKKHTDASVSIIAADDIILPDQAEGAASSFLGSKKQYNLSDADGYIVIAPEYESGKETTINHVIQALRQNEGTKPVAFVSYGLEGGYNLVNKLRTQARKANLAPLRNAVHLASPWELIDQSGELHDQVQEKNLQLLIKQLSGWMALSQKSATA
jgi:NAD(P)H-dependent FMN reductase